MPAAVAAAPAKVNLFLEVTGKRPDGYHAVETLMLAVDLCDELEVADDPAGELSLRCDDPTLPTDSRNLVVRTAAALREKFAPGRGARMSLTKRVPHQAGLGGGSSDAATTLAVLDRVWSLGLPVETLREVAGGIGSDVGFFLTPPAGWCTGRGEVVEPLALGRPLDLVIVKPSAGLSTSDVYRRLRVPENPIAGDACRRAMAAGDVETLGGLLFNRLEEAAVAAEPSVGDVLRVLGSCGPLGCRLSGSGSACFALCRDRDHAARVAELFRAAWPAGGEILPRTFVVRSWP